jgi:hypothetical protein
MSISQGDRIHLLRSRTLATYSTKNPSAPVSITIDKETLNSIVVGKMTITVQPPESGPYSLRPCCPPTSVSCTPPTSSTVNVGFPQGPPPSPYDLSYNIFFDISWNPFPNATSYVLTTDSSDSYLFVSTGPTSSTFYVEWTGSNSCTVSVIGINECGSATSSGTAFPCFLAGSRVAMADGSEKAIEDVVVGDIVIGAFGEHNRVLALHRPLVGSSRMCRINDEHSTTSHHPHISAGRQFYCCEPERVIKHTYGRYHAILKEDGSTGFWKLHGLRPERIQTLVEGVQLKTIDGSRPVQAIEYYELPPETQLYNLVVAGSHTYHVDGYAVTGWPREDDFDYDTWAPRI